MNTITVLVPAFNCSNVLSKCLSALADQTVQPLETIVVDDGSQDDTADVAESFDGVKIVRRAKQGGAGAAQATGAKEARGDILAFIDSDCLAPPDWLEKVLAEFEQDPKLNAVGGMYRHCHAKSLTSIFSKFEEEYLHGLFDKSPNHSTLTGGNKAVKKSVWDECRSGRELIHFRNVASSEDTVVANEIRAAGKTLFKADIFVFHQPKNDFKGFFKRNITRARTRMLGNLHGLYKGGDNVFVGFGGFRLFWSAAALWGAAVLLLAQLSLVWPWPGAVGLGLLAMHFWLAADYFKFVNSNHERPCPIEISFIQSIGIRLLLAARAACWVLGTLIGIVQYGRDRMQFYWNVVASILHFWRPGKVSKMFYFVTSKCNARCEFCFNLENIVNWKARQKDELTLEEVQKVTASFGRLPYVTFSGGEPFARTDLAEVAGALPDDRAIERRLRQLLIVVGVVQELRPVLGRHLEPVRRAIAERAPATREELAACAVWRPLDQTVEVGLAVVLVGEDDVAVSVGHQAMGVHDAGALRGLQLLGNVLVHEITLSADDRRRSRRVSQGREE